MDVQTTANQKEDEEEDYDVEMIPTENHTKPEWWVDCPDNISDEQLWAMYHIACMLLANKLICFCELGALVSAQMNDDEWITAFGKNCFDRGMCTVGTVLCCVRTDCALASTVDVNACTAYLQIGQRVGCLLLTVF